MFRNFQFSSIFLKFDFFHFFHFFNFFHFFPPNFPPFGRCTLFLCRSNLLIRLRDFPTCPPSIILLLLLALTLNDTYLRRIPISITCNKVKRSATYRINRTTTAVNLSRCLRDAWKKNNELLFWINRSSGVQNLLWTLETRLFSEIVFWFQKSYFFHKPCFYLFTSFFRQSQKVFEQLNVGGGEFSGNFLLW